MKMPPIKLREKKLAKQLWILSFLIAQGIIGLFISGCGAILPAKTPPQLEHAPAAFLVITDRELDTGVFRVRYPAGWRVVKTSVAEAPMQIVIVSPDDQITITLSEVLTRGMESDFLLYRELGANVIVRALGKAPDERIDELAEVFGQITGSLQPGSG